MNYQRSRLFCARCGKTPGELPEYSTLGYDDPYEACYKEEGTLNYQTGEFLCNQCYIAAGMPSSPSGWVVPSVMPSVDDYDLDDGVYSDEL